MDELFNQLEGRLRSLIQSHQFLSQSNSNLKQHQSTLSREKDLLLAKNKIAILQIETMVSRLKAIEKSL